MAEGVTGNPSGNEYRVDELARAAGTTVRNVRAYQDRGLLPGPRRQGRVGWYSEVHLARLRLVQSLLDRGYTLANIAELVGAWERGQEVGELAGFERALVRPWTEEAPATLSIESLLTRMGQPPADEAAAAFEAAVELGIIAPDAEDETAVVVLSPGTLETGAVLIAAGVPLGPVIEVVRQMHADLDHVAHLFVELIEREVIDPLGEAMPASEVARVGELVERLRPLAKVVVDAELSRAMDRHIGERFGERLSKMLAAEPPAVD